MAETSLYPEVERSTTARSTWFYRAIYDFIFFMLIIIVLLNIVFGIIIDTFSKLRAKRDEKIHNMVTTCFICGISRDQFDQEGTSDFTQHCAFEHNKWDYLFYLIHCQHLHKEEPDDMNAYELYVHKKFQEGDTSWMPLGQALALKSTAQEE